MANDTLPRRRKKSLPSPIKGIQNIIRNSFYKDLFDTPPSPVRMTSFSVTCSPPVIKEDQISDYFNMEDKTSPIYKKSTSPVWSTNSSSSGYSSESSILSADNMIHPNWLGIDIDCQEPMVNSAGELINLDKIPVFKDIEPSTEKKTQTEHTTNPLIYTTIRRKRGGSQKQRKTKSQEGVRRSWELEEWQRLMKSYTNIRHSTYQKDYYPLEYESINEKINQYDFMEKYYGKHH